MSNDALKMLEELRKKQEELLRQINAKKQEVIEQFKAALKEPINELVNRYNTMMEADKRVKELTEELKLARENYAYHSTKFREQYDKLVNMAKESSPESVDLLNQTVLQIAPELKNVLSENTKTVAKQVSRFLSSQASLIDPFTGKTYVSWTDALRDRGKENLIRGDSPHRVFMREFRYDLVPLDETTQKTIIDCNDTPGCIENLADRVVASKHPLEPNDIIDTINDFLRAHPAQSI